MGSNAEQVMDRFMKKLYWYRDMNEDDWMNYALLEEARKYRPLTTDEQHLLSTFESMRTEFFYKVLDKLDVDTGIEHVILQFDLNLDDWPCQVFIAFTEKSDMNNEECIGRVSMTIDSLCDKDIVDKAFAQAEMYRQNDQEVTVNVKPLLQEEN